MDGQWIDYGENMDGEGGDRWGNVRDRSDATVLVSYLIQTPQGDGSQLFPYRPNVGDGKKWVEGEGQSRP